MAESRLPNKVKRLLGASSVIGLAEYLEELDLRVGRLEEAQGITSTPEEKQADVLEKISFVIKDDNGPIQGAHVTIAGKSGNTGKAGGCNISDIPEDTYDCEVTAKGYEPYTGKITVDKKHCKFPIILTEAKS